MKKIEVTNGKSSGWRKFEFGLLCVCLILLAVRGTHVESLFNTLTDSVGVLDRCGLSIVLTSVPIALAALWGMLSFSRRKVNYKITGMEIGAIVFVAAGIIAVTGASNKRDAINYAVTIASILLMAILMVQLMDSRMRIRIVLMAAVAAGAVNSYQCAEQYFVSNQMMLDQYENNQEAQLAQLGIEPGSLDHSLYLHRLESMDVRGFFTTGNSAAAFNVLALIAVLILMTSEMRSGLEARIKSRNMLIYCFYAVWLGMGIVLTHSKGGIGGLLAAAVLFGVCSVCIKWLGKYCRGLVMAGVVIGVLGIAAIGTYGANHELGGGNSMMVRWQYWACAMQVLKDNLVTGVGGGNFGQWYTMYKDASAIETVKDPHCFVLSLACQYGLIGMLGFVAAFGVVMLKSALGRHEFVRKELQTEEAGKWKHGAIAAIVITIGMALLRPFFMSEYLGSKFEEIAFMIMYTYVMPAVIFAVAMLFLWLGGKERNENEVMFSKTEIVLGLCGLVGVLVHNLIDFAIFEPGILTLFMVLAACVCAMNKDGEKQETVKLGRVASICGVAVCMIVVGVFAKFAFVPVVKAGSLRQQAMKNYQNAPALLEAASAIDKYNPEFYEMSGKLHLQMFMKYTAKEELLKSSVEKFQLAMKRNPSNFKYYEKAGQAYKLWAEILMRTDRDAANEKLKLAYENLLKAVELYPESGRLNYKLGEVCEGLGMKEAGEYYAKAVEIEDAFRAMYLKMYPGRELTSRLGDTQYLRAKEKAN